MKKFLLILSLMMAFVFQANAYHWNVNINQYPNTMTFVGVIQIDGEEMTGTHYELGAFCGDECRGRETTSAQLVQIFNRYFVMLTVYGNDGDVISFRVYDEDLGMELDLDCSTSVTFATNNSFGNAIDPFVFDFTSAVAPGGYHWDVNIHQYPNTMTFVGAIVIDGVEQTSSDLELGVFCGNECRGREKATLFQMGPISRYLVYLTAYGEDGNALSFRLYDHGINQELDLTNTNELVFATNGAFGNPVNPYVFDFVSATVTSHNITATADPVQGGTIAGAGEYEHGAICTLTATANTGYTFDNWTDNGLVVSTNATYSFSVTGDRTLVAHFTVNPVNYTITATANPTEGGTVTGTGTFEQGSLCTLTATANDGYSFTKWTENGVQVSTNPTYAFTVTSDRALVANFEENASGEYHWNVNIHQYPNSMTFVGVIVIDGVEQTRTDLELGVFSGNECRGREKATLFQMGPISRYLVYLTAYGEDGDALGFRLYDHAIHQELNLTNTNELNFVTNGAHGNPVNPYVFDFVSAAVTTHTITATADPVQGGTITGAGEYEHGATCTLTATANAGYAFNNWTENGLVVSSSATYSFSVTGDRTLVAHFTVNPVNYTITATANPAEGGMVSGTGTFEQGSLCTLTATANEGYSFTNWTENGVQVSTNPTYAFTVTSNRALVANFEENTSGEYHWNVNIHQYPNTMTGTGIIVIDGVEQARTDLELGVFCGNECRGREKPTLFQMGPISRYILYLTIYGEDGDVLNFRLYDHGINQELNLNCSNEMTFATNQAFGNPVNPYVFDFYSAVVTHTITATADPVSGGNITGTGDYNHGSSCTLTATASSNYAFVNWTENGEVVSTEAVYTFTVTNDRVLVAHFTSTLVDYNIAASAEPAEGGTVTGAGVYTQGTNCTLVATANSGYSFSQWTENGVVVSTNATYSFTVTGNRTLVAQFEEVSSGYHWDVNIYQFANNMTINGVIFIDGIEQPRTDLELGVFCGNECRGRERPTLFQMGPISRYILYLTAYGEDGDAFTFRLYDHSLGQELDTLRCLTTMSFVTNGSFGNPVNPFVFEFVSAMYYDVTATANPENGGTVAGAGSYLEDTECTLVATPNTGYHFVNWMKNNQVVSTEANYTFTVTENVALVANFGLNNYDITATADPTDGGTVTGAGIYNHFSTCTLTASANTGYDFVNWTLNGLEVSTNVEYSFIVTGAAEYVAHFALKSYEITATVDPENAGTVEGTGTYDHFSTCTLTATPGTGYHFANWTVNNEVVSTDAQYSFVVTGPVSLVAHFALNSYEITATTDPTDGGTVTGAGTYNHFSTCTLTATANTGYDFVNWTLNGEMVSTNAEYSFIVTGAAEYVAHFTLKSYEITATVDPENAGTVEGTGTYEHFSTCTLTATPSTGYHFVNWTVNNEVVSTDTQYSFEVTGPVSLVAHFALNSYEITVSVDPEDAGTVEGTGTYNHFSTCTLIATANTGYDFVNWTLDGEVVSSNAEYSFTVTGAAEYVAHFALKSYEITATVEPEETGAVEGTGTYEHFSTCTLTAIPTVGYHFASWTIDGEEVSTEAEYSFEVTGPVSLVAHFALNSYEVTVVANPTYGGTVSGGGTFIHGTQATIMATSGEQFIFSNWMKDGEIITNDSIYTFIVTEEAVYTANFERITATQITPFQSGWNWYSTYIDQSAPDYSGLEMIQNSLGSNGVIIKAQEQASTYMEYQGYAFWYGDLTSIDNVHAYKIRTTAACEVSMTGSVIHPQDYPISINTGWNWIGYPSMDTLDFYTAFSNVTPTQGDAIKTQDDYAEFMVYGEYRFWYGSLTSLDITPGMGLMYKSMNNQTYSFTYPEANRSAGTVRSVAPKRDLHWEANRAAYSDNMTVTAVIEWNGEELLSDQYELAAFANGECRGSAKLEYFEPLNRYVAYLLVSGDEAATLNFGLYETESGMEYFTAVEYLGFTINANYGNPVEPFIIHFNGLTGVEDMSSHLQVFPNPVGRGERVNLGWSVEGSHDIHVDIINALGAVVRSESVVAMPAGITVPNVAGVYTLRIIADGKNVCYRKLIVR